jgi:6-pyruvoyltetrahydropterin/6-carboxytetrahydropterin synthase
MALAGSAAGCRDLNSWRARVERVMIDSRITGTATFRIGKRFTFDAAHHLPSLPADHKCSRVHGHTYTVEFVLESSELTGPGFVTDFGDLTVAGRYLVSRDSV